ncbi:hypothetical protein NKR23_g10895 [Pleurostoma richardsiae]|uniref:Uncharacterized protein n=1 Tax=Pleurostoma richardsiae TaxID=41990 RepID=A0AA38VHW6_9PEZI|nr:hypothetical protein NKR23_g10895 [Pleurostoma richardsiae]
MAQWPSDLLALKDGLQPLSDYYYFVAKGPSEADADREFLDWPSLEAFIVSGSIVSGPVRADKTRIVIRCQDYSQSSSRPVTLLRLSVGQPASHETYQVYASRLEDDSKGGLGPRLLIAGKWLDILLLRASGCIKRRYVWAPPSDNIWSSRADLDWCDLMLESDDRCDLMLESEVQKEADLLVNRLAQEADSWRSLVEPPEYQALMDKALFVATVTRDGATDQLVQMLCAMGSNPFARVKDEDSAFRKAAMGKRRELVGLFIEYLWIRQIYSRSISQMASRINAMDDAERRLRQVVSLEDAVARVFSGFPKQFHQLQKLTASDP